MKNIKLIFTVIFLIGFWAINAQEKKIKFNKGTLRICSSKQFQIEGYDGDEVVIKSLHEKREENSPWVVRGYAKSKNLAKVSSTTIKEKDSLSSSNFVFFNIDNDRKKGLKKLGKKNQNADLGIYFTIEERDGELLFKDQNQVRFIMASNERYLVKIPNTIKLNWSTNNCSEESKNSQVRFFNSKASSLSYFKGEVEITSTLNNMKLKDVSGPVTVNTIGGNVTIEFEKEASRKFVRLKID